MRFDGLCLAGALLAGGCRSEPRPALSIPLDGPRLAARSSAADSSARSTEPSLAPPTMPPSERDPWIESTDSGPAVHLPPAMARALAQTFPRFKPWPWATYPAEIRARYHGSNREGIWAVVGDFNKDGRLDIALDGSDRQVFPSGDGADIVSIIAVLTSGDTAIAERVTEGRLFAGDSAGVPRPRWLVLVPARSFRRRLNQDAIGVPEVGSKRRDLAPGQVFLWWVLGGRPRFVMWSDGE